VNVILIALDTQRADHLGCYGYPRPTSQFLDELAGQGVLFERCYAPNIPTHPSFTTMHSGKEAITHNVINIGGKAEPAPGVRLLAEILHEQGYYTAAVDNMRRHFPRGFDLYQDYAWDRSTPGVLRKAETVTANVLTALDAIKETSKPYFLFVHYWDPHTPYLPPEPYRQRFYPAGRDPHDRQNTSMDKVWAFEPFRWYFHSWLPGVTDTAYVNACYDAETAYMDEHLRPVFARLRELGLDQDTVVVITADHGEVLDEHEGHYDHHGLYEANVHVPLIMWAPGRLAAGTRVPGLVQNLDLAPTILDLCGVPNTEGMEGKSLLPCLLGLRDGNYEEVYFSEATWQVKRAVRRGRWKFIKALQPSFHPGSPPRELYDLAADPEEQRNVVEQHPEVAADLERRLDAYVARRLAETGRTVDPAIEQGVSGTRIGKPPEDPAQRENYGRHYRAPVEAPATPTTVPPDPSELHARQ
jgi:arylsulfatase